MYKKHTFSDILQITTINCFNRLLLNQHTSKPYVVACTLDGGSPLVQMSTNNVTELIEKADVTSICFYHLSPLVVVLLLTRQAEKFKI